MNALVTGATGLIGRQLVARLGHAKVLVRDPRRAPAGTEAFAWDSAAPVPPEALRDVDVVFHLAGEPVAGGRLTDARKRSIRDSRVVGTRRIVEALAELEKPPVLVSASAVGFYGSRGDEVLTEESGPGSDFLAEVCVEWEREALAAHGVRVVCARIGIVLAREGGALASMKPAFRFGVGGPLGSGKQWTPWIHVDDVVGLLLHAAEHADIEGPMNVCAPTPVTNRDFASALGRAMHRPSFFSAPRAVLRIVLGEMSDMVVASARAIPAKAAATGYAFRFASLDDALLDLL